MAAPHEKLAQSLAELTKLQGQGARVIRSSQLSRTHRERLIQSGFLAEVLNGWQPAVGTRQMTIPRWTHHKKGASEEAPL